MNFDNIWGALSHFSREKHFPRSKRALREEILSLHRRVDSLATTVEQLGTICIHKYDNRNCWDGHGLHDVVIALLEHTGLKVKKQHGLYLGEED